MSILFADNAESTSVSDSATISLIMQAITNESISTSDYETANIITSSSTTEILTATDYSFYEAQAYNLSVNESVSVSDNTSDEKFINVTTVEVLSMADSNGVIGNIRAYCNEYAAPVDMNIATYSTDVTMNEYVTLVESFTGNKNGLPDLVLVMDARYDKVFKYKAMTVKPKSIPVDFVHTWSPDDTTINKRYKPMVINKIRKITNDIIG